MSVTIKDVARQANVSPGTVSNVLSGKRPVSLATRLRVLQVIEELGYRPNLLARSLVTQRSDTVAVVVSGLEYYGPSRTLVGIEQQAEKLGYSLLLNLLHHPSDSAGEAALAAVAARRVDGIVWAVAEVGNSHAWIPYDNLAELPPIIFLTTEPRPGLPVVAVDNRAGAALATRHLFDQGRRTIALVSGPLTWWEARERCAGWRAALHQAGLEPAGSLVVEGDWTAASAEQALYRLLEQRPDVDAVLACNDLMALGVLRAAQVLGRRVPQDLAVVGFDNMPETPFFCPPLSSVRQHLVDLGCAAVQELHRLVVARQQGQADLAPSSPLILAPDLVIRESSS